MQHLAHIPANVRMRNRSDTLALANRYRAKLSSALHLRLPISSAFLGRASNALTGQAYSSGVFFLIINIIFNIAQKHYFINLTQER